MNELDEALQKNWQQEKIYTESNKELKRRIYRRAKKDSTGCGCDYCMSQAEIWRDEDDDEDEYDE